MGFFYAVPTMLCLLHYPKRAAVISGLILGAIGFQFF